MKLKWNKVDRTEYTAGGTRYEYRVFTAHGKNGWQVAEEDRVHGDVPISQSACVEREDAQALAQEWEDVEARSSVG